MNKSQLRLLAAEVAEGRIPPGEYRARRRELIDNIVAGTTSIERVQPSWLHNADEGDDEATTLNSRNEHAESSPRHSEKSRLPVPVPVLLGGGAVLCIVFLIALLWPESEPEVAKLTPPVIPSAEEISRSRALVESFVARRDFGTDAIDEFRRDWQQLDEKDREQAPTELWFGSLVRAIRDEVKTQNALAGMSDGEAALARAKAAFALGEFLGVSNKLPAIDEEQLASTASIDTATLAAPGAGPMTSTNEAVNDDVPRDSMTSTNADTATTTQSDDNTTVIPAMTTSSMSGPTGRQWLAARDDGQLTLQIFAVNNLDRVEQLIAQHPTLDVHVLATEGAAPRYRIFHGVFANEEQARQAYAALPADITQASHGAIVKSFSVVREDLQAQETATPSAPATLAADKFALQLFATGNRDNAQALVRAFPALNLQLREMSGDAAPYRVVYGEYASADDARAAASALPPALLSRIGTPLPKPLDSLGKPATL